MPTLLTSDDKAKIKRHISQASNKIITAGIARLYVALPRENRWKDTGLTGAAVLAYDEVGKCFFFKLVDVIGNQGILWDQELYEGFQYHQDRTFFHSFEIQDCIAAFSFADEHEARNFYTKVESRQKKVSAKSGGIGRMGSKMKGLFGKSDKQEHARNDSTTLSPYAPQANSPRTSTIDPNDPEWAGLSERLAEMGITEDQIAGNEEFIKSFIASKQAEEPEAPMRGSSRQVSHSTSAAAAPRSHAPPPPPPPSIAVSSPSVPAPGPPPPPPPGPPASSAPAPTTPAPRKLPPPVSANTPPMRSLPPPVSPNLAQRETSPRDSIDSGRKAVPPPPPASRSKNKPPPPPARGTARVVSTPEPPSRAPALPGKIPLDDDKPRFNVPPPFEGVRKTASLSRKVPAAPAVPSRNGPAVPSRNSGPPIPNRSSGPPVPTRGNDSRPTPPPPSGGIPPPPPPAGGMPPPPPPMMGSSIPPPPPSGPPAAKLDVPTAPGRDDLMASIRAGNKTKLRKATTVDKSGPMIPGAASSTATPPRGGAGPAGGGGNDMASQLAAMLGERNKKVAVHNSDDEDDEDW